MLANRRKNTSKHTFLDYVCFAFLFFCFMPFLFPNPIATTDIQPYAAVLGIVVILFKLSLGEHTVKVSLFGLIAIFTFIIAVLIIPLNPVSLKTFRAVYNYLAVMIVPIATCICLEHLGEYPERFAKVMLLSWLVVAVIQLLFSRSFMSWIISGSRWRSPDRGVLGLASEPSFFGIACFYFLHVVRYFKTQKLLFTVLVCFMSLICAQSAMGVVFMLGYFLVYLFDIINTRKGFLIWVAALVGAAVFIYLLDHYMEGTRLYRLYQEFLENGIKGLVEDRSGGTRVNSISSALGTLLDNHFMPAGFSTRIGSGFGGFLVELGVFALPILACISFGMACTFQKIRSRIFYFIVITILLLNNTQLGNPLLMMVIGTNLWMSVQQQTDGMTYNEKNHNTF